MRVLVTRPEGAAEQTAGKLESMGHEAVLAPLLKTNFLDVPISGLDRAQAVIFTSTNGVEGFARISKERALPIYVVGARTAQAARDAGFGDVESADGDASDLAALLRERLVPASGPVIFARARQVAGDLTQTLARAGFAVHSAVVYETAAVEKLPEVLRTCLLEDSLDEILFFSPRTAHAFARLLEKEGLAGHTASIVALCLSQKVADQLIPLKWRAVRVANDPNQAALLALL